MFDLPVYCFPHIWISTAGQNRLRLLHIYLLFYLALHLPVPYISFDRYLIPFAPVSSAFPGYGVVGGYAIGDKRS
jgi:hypothetical protein